jgi:hypothetical protein
LSQFSGLSSCGGFRDIKNKLRRSFADKANDFALTLKTLSLAISGLALSAKERRSLFLMSRIVSFMS